MEKHRLIQVVTAFLICGLVVVLLLITGLYQLGVLMLFSSILYLAVAVFVYWKEWQNYKEYRNLEEFQAIKDVVVSDIKRFFLVHDDENVITWGCYGRFAFEVMFEHRKICWIPQYCLVVDKFRISLPYYAEKEFITIMKQRMKELRRKKHEKSPQRQEAESFVDKLKCLNFMDAYAKKNQKK